MLRLNSASFAVKVVKVPRFYRGAGVGTYYHPDVNDATQSGFIAQSPIGGSLAGGLTGPLIRALMEHISSGTVNSPFVSLSRSYGIALSYAIYFSLEWPTQDNPAFVYQIDIDPPLPRGLAIFDPIHEIAEYCPPPLSNASFQHDGDSGFLLDVLSGDIRNSTRPAPPNNIAPVSRPPSLTPELEALVRAVRDAEVLAMSTIPGNCVTEAWAVYI